MMYSQTFFIISKLLDCDIVEDIKELYPEAYPFAMDCLKKKENKRL